MNFGQFSMTTHVLGEYMKLDAAAVSALGLQPDPTQGMSLTRPYTRYVADLHQNCKSLSRLSSDPSFFLVFLSS